MQRTQERKQENVNKIPPTILEEENEASGSAMSAGGDSNLEDRELFRTNNLKRCKIEDVGETKF